MNEKYRNESNAQMAQTKPEPATSAREGLAIGGLIASRQSGRAALFERVTKLRREADRLEALARAIPENFPLDADEGLWELVVSRR